MKIRSKIIAVDFDGTLCESVWPGIGKPKMDVINYIKQQQENGAKIILWTCRTGDKLTEALDWCFTHGLEFDAVNENLEEAILWYGGDTRKIFADEYIDDKAAKSVKTTIMIDNVAYISEIEKENAELKERVEELSKTINKRIDYFRKFNENKYKFEIRELRNENEQLKAENKALEANREMRLNNCIKCSKEKKELEERFKETQERCFARGKRIEELVNETIELKDQIDRLKDMLFPFK